MTETDNVPVGRFGHSAVVYQSGMWGARSQKLPTDDRFYRDQSCQSHCAPKLLFQHLFGFRIILAVGMCFSKAARLAPPCPGNLPASGQVRFWWLGWTRYLGRSLWVFYHNQSMVTWTQRLGVKSGWLKPGEWVAAVYNMFLVYLHLQLCIFVK